MQVLGHGCQRDVVGLGELTDAFRAVGYLFENVPTDRVSQRLEYRVEIEVVRPPFNYPVE